MQNVTSTHDQPSIQTTCQNDIRLSLADVHNMSAPAQRAANLMLSCSSQTCRSPLCIHARRLRMCLCRYSSDSAPLARHATTNESSSTAYSVDAKRIEARAKRAGVFRHQGYSFKRRFVCDVKQQDFVLSGFAL